MVDGSQPRYQADQALMQSDLRADSRSQLVEKAVGLLVDSQSVAKNYGALRDKLMSRSGDFVTTVVRESAPEAGKDGLVMLTTEAVVNVKAVQKSLNEMSRNERIEFIRASGDPRVGVRIVTRDADAPDAPPQVSPAAENILKERIKSFGFRTWSDGEVRPGDPKARPDFMVEGEAKIKRLSMKLAASGLVVTKYALNGWTIKCIDLATGEEIYYNTKLPTARAAGQAKRRRSPPSARRSRANSRATSSCSMWPARAAGRRSASTACRPRSATISCAANCSRCRPCSTCCRRARRTLFELQLAGSGPAADLVGAGILKPLNAKLGRACFVWGRRGR